MSRMMRPLLTASTTAAPRIRHRFGRMAMRLLALALPFIALATLTAQPAAAQDGYRLQAGDTVVVEILEDPSLNRTLLIAPDGRISVPLAGGVQAGGRTLEGVQSTISARLAPNFATAPTVYVALVQPRPRDPERPPEPDPTIEIFVVGEVGNRGRVVLDPGANVLQLFSQVGGFTKFAAVKRLQLRRGAQTILLNYRAIEDGTSPLGTMQVHDGDVLIVPQRRLFE